LERPVPRTLSKSDFKTAQTCPTKLFYKELGYPSTKDDNPYLRMLAWGGYMVEKMAKLLHPDGVELPYDGGSERSAQLTREALERDTVTLFEATLLSRAKLARVDILAKHGGAFDLIEVKAKSYSSTDVAARAAAGKPSIFRDAKGRILEGWRPYLEDVTFQVLVLDELFPNMPVTPYLALVDKAKTSSADAIHQLFRINRSPSQNGGPATVSVEYTGDVDQLRADNLIGVLDVSKEVEDLFEDVQAAATRYLVSYEPFAKIPTPLSLNCDGCEFRASATDPHDGFLECWGELGRVEPHLFELYYLSTVGPTSDPLGDQLIRQGKCSLFDIPIERLVKKDGDIGTRNRRQVIQIEHTRHGTSWLSDELAAGLARYPYPLRFIDFETSALAVPYHVNMHPYETVAFQWSCHTVAAPGAKPVHEEWINTVDFFPNLEFARTLRECVGIDGTTFMWAPHESTVLRAIARLAAGRGTLDSGLADWILDLAGRRDESPGRLVDMNAMAVGGYFHPAMGKRTSIKYVLAAVWGADPELRVDFPEYVRHDGERLLGPYDALPPIRIADTDVVVTEGTGAMLAYQEMLYGESRVDQDAKARYRDLLRQYCRLDTAAMLMIWQHWSRLATRMPRLPAASLTDLRSAAEVTGISGPLNRPPPT
jgi:uncharacterized protein DUF2779